MKVYVYIDGFNLYYRALQGTRFKWLNPARLAERLVRPGDSVDRIRYFTARVSARSGDPGAPRRQQILLNALSTVPNIRFHYGKFLAKTKRRPLVSDPSTFVEIHDTEEKGSDVNLASHLINDGWKGRYDTAFVLSQDTDLIEPIRIVAKELGRNVGLVWLDGGRPNKNLASAATFVRHIRPSDLAAAQFPNTLFKADGTEIRKPASW